MSAYLYESKTINTMIVMAILGVRTKRNEKLGLTELQKWTPNDTLRPTNWSQVEWEKLCQEIITIKMLETVKQENSEGDS